MNKFCLNKSRRLYVEKYVSGVIYNRAFNLALNTNLKNLRVSIKDLINDSTLNELQALTRISYTEQ